MTNHISSLQNARIKNVAKLRDRRDRDRQQRTLIDGVHEMSRAIQAGVRLVEVFIAPDLRSETELQAILASIPEGTEIITVTKQVFQRMAFGERFEGVLAVAETPTANLESLVLPANPLVAVLEGVEKPGNVGAVLRSADATGVAALIAADSGTDLYNPNTIRASLGTVFAVPARSATTAETLAWLRQQGLKIFAARVDGSIPYTEVDYRPGTAIVLGSEAEGLSDAWLQSDVAAVRLPMLGVADSLNVSATAAVLFYEALRQRNKK